MLKFSKIPRVDKFVSIIENTENDIYVTEKLDGANASFMLEDGELKCFSRNQQLTPDNGLRGFYQWVQENINPNELVEGYKYYGEWLVQHKIDYKDMMGKFVLFAIRRTTTEFKEYLHFDYVQSQGEMLNLPVVHLHYRGKYDENFWNMIEEVKEKSAYPDVEFAEGVVIFIPDEVFPRMKDEQVYLKVISDKFAEVKRVKPTGKGKKKTLEDLIRSLASQERMDKLIMKKIDEGELEEELGYEDIGLIIKTVMDDFATDVIEEEGDVITEEVIRVIKRDSPLLIRKHIDERRGL